MIIYSLGGGEVIYNVFQAIALCLNGGGSLLVAFMRIGGLVGVLMAYCSTLYGNIWEIIKSWGIPVLLIMHLFFVPTTKVLIVDNISKFSYSVDNIPYGLAFFASNISSIGQAITEQIEQNFSLVDDLQYHKNGMMFGSRILEQAKTFRITNKVFKNNFHHFVDQCIKYDIMLNYKYSFEDLENSVDIWGLVSSDPSHNRGFFWEVPGDKSQFITCAQAVSRFDNMWSNEIDRNMDKLGRNMFSGKFNRFLGSKGGESVRMSPDFNNALKSEIKNSLTSTMQYLADVSTSAEEALKQAILINSLESSSSDISKASGNLSNYAEIKSLLQQNLTFKTTGKLFSKMLVIIYSLIQALLYACFIFVIPMCMIPNGYKFLINWVMALVWLQLWAPLYAILNYVMNVAARASIITQIGLVKGVTIGNFVGLSEVNEQMSTIAGYMSAFVPVIAMIITKGLGDLVSISRNVVNSSVQSIGAAASEATNGNFSYGNINLRNRSEDTLTQTQRNYNSVLGIGGHTEDTGTVRISSDSIYDRIVFNRQVSQGAVQGSANTSMAEQYYNSYQMSKQRANEAASNWSKSMSVLQQKTLKVAKAFAKQSTMGLSRALNVNKEIGEQLSQSASVVSNLASSGSHAKNESSNTHWGIEGNANVSYAIGGKGSDKKSKNESFLSKLSGLISGGISGGWSSSTDKVTSHSTSTTEQANNQTSLDESIRKFSSLLNSINVTNGMSEEMNMVRDWAQTYQHTQSYAKSFALHNRKAAEASKQYSISMNSSVGEQRTLRDDAIRIGAKETGSYRLAERTLDQETSSKGKRWFNQAKSKHLSGKSNQTIGFDNLQDNSIQKKKEELIEAVNPMVSSNEDYKNEDLKKEFNIDESDFQIFGKDFSKKLEDNSFADQIHTEISNNTNDVNFVHDQQGMGSFESKGESNSGYQTIVNKGIGTFEDNSFADQIHTEISNNTNDVNLVREKQGMGNFESKGESNSGYQTIVNKGIGTFNEQLINQQYSMPTKAKFKEQHYRLSSEIKEKLIKEEVIDNKSSKDD